MEIGRVEWERRQNGNREVEWERRWNGNREGGVGIGGEVGIGGWSGNRGVEWE